VGVGYQYIISARMPALGNGGDQEERMGGCCCKHERNDGGGGGGAGFEQKRPFNGRGAVSRKNRPSQRAAGKVYTTELRQLATKWSTWCARKAN